MKAIAGMITEISIIMKSPFYTSKCIQFALLYRQSMELIKLFLLGAIGYLLAGLYDVAILHQKSLLKRIFFIGFFITAVPYPIIFLTTKSPLSTLAIGILLFLMLIFTLLLIYSVFLEFIISPDTTGKLFRKGTYSFSRHPGFIWYTVINILIAIYFWNYQIALLCLGYSICNLLLIIVEDLIFFPRMFPEYADYKKETPFFLSLQNLTHRRKARND